MTDQQEQSGTADADQVYDGFISYSHAADGLLAPRLQAGLQRFAKPWWKRRAVRIFRDESSLSANPHLWSSITGALDASGWFILLLSPDAAASPWVNQEIEYWKTRRDPSRILPVVTDGEFGWDGTDVAGDAVPDELEGAFSEEPRWVDLRFARGVEQLDLKNPRFADAVADIASTIRGTPKDELAGEEVRQHRRTVRTAWMAGVALAATTIAAVGFGIIASDSARLARTRELSASAQAVVARDPELAILLSLEAFDLGRKDMNWAAIDVLRTALDADRVVARIQPTPAAGGAERAEVRLSADGTVAVVSDSAVRLIDRTTGNVRWTFDDPSVADRFLTADISPDASVVVVATHGHGAVHDGDERGHGDHDESPEGDDPAGPINRESSSELIVLDAASGAIVERFSTGACEDFRTNIHHPSFSPDGRWLALLSGTERCTLEEPGEGWVEIWDVGTWSPVHRLDLGLGDQVHFATEAELAVVSGVGGGTMLVNATTLEPLAEFDRDMAAISPDGGTIALGTFGASTGTIDLVDVTSGATVGSLAGWDGPLGRSLYFSPDGDFVLAETRLGEISVWDAGRGVLVDTTRAEVSNGLAIDPSGTTYVSNQTSALQLAFPPTPLGRNLDLDVAAYGPYAIGDAGQREWLTTSAGVAAITAEVGGEPHLVAFDVTSGRALDVTAGSVAVSMRDGRFVVPALDDRGTALIWHPGVGSSLFDACGGGDCSGPRVPVSMSADGSTVGVFFSGRLRFVSADGYASVDVPDDVAEVMAISQDWAVVSRWGIREVYVVWADGRSVDPLGIAHLAPISVFPDTDGGALVLTETGSVLRYDQTWGLVDSWAVDGGTIAGEVSPHGIVVLTTDGTIQVHDPESGSMMSRMTIPGAVAVSWIDSATLAVVTADGVWRSEPLHLADLIASGRVNVSRSFTHPECELYRIDPCPSLEEVRSG